MKKLLFFVSWIISLSTSAQWSNSQESKVQFVLSQMTIEEKVGQMTQINLDVICEGEIYKLVEPHHIDPDKLKSFKRLEKFAEKGYLLLDLIPFAIDFNKHVDLRLQISSNQQLMSCFMEALEVRVSRLAHDGFLNPEWDFCFVGPETTSVGIMEFIEKEKKGLFTGKTLDHCDDKMGADDFTYHVTRKNKKTGMTITATQIKTNYTTHPTPGGEISHISKRARLTTIIGGSGPHSELIQRAFGL